MEQDCLGKVPDFEGESILALTEKIDMDIDMWNREERCASTDDALL